MLVSKHVVENKTSLPPAVSVGDTVRLRDTNRIGIIERFRNGKWVVRLSQGSLVECETTNLEKRQFLAE